MHAKPWSRRPRSDRRSQRAPTPKPSVGFRRGSQSEGCHRVSSSERNFAVPCATSASLSVLSCGTFFFFLFLRENFTADSAHPPPRLLQLKHSCAFTVAACCSTALRLGMPSQSIMVADAVTSRRRTRAMERGGLGLRLRTLRAIPSCPPGPPGVRACSYFVQGLRVLPGRRSWRAAGTLPYICRSLVCVFDPVHVKSMRHNHVLSEHIRSITV